jgi:hypothetical protein
MTDKRRFKVTVWYVDKPKEIYRNQTSKEATAWERKFVKDSKIKNVRVENETGLRIVKDE